MKCPDLPIKVMFANSPIPPWRDGGVILLLQPGIRLDHQLAWYQCTPMWIPSPQIRAFVII